MDNKYFKDFDWIDKEKSKIHIARMPLSMNNYQKEDLFATVLICLGFKSISFFEPELHPAILSKIANRPRKTEKQKLDNALWVDAKIMGYIKQHPKRCSCLGNSLITKLGTNECIFYHDMEDLSFEYINILTNPKYKAEVLQLEAIQPILRKLRVIA